MPGNRAISSSFAAGQLRKSTSQITPKQCPRTVRYIEGIDGEAFGPSPGIEQELSLVINVTHTAGGERRGDRAPRLLTAAPFFQPRST